MKRSGLLWWGLMALCTAMIPMSAVADDFADYKTAAGTTAEVDLPTISGGYGMTMDYFPSDTAALVDGKFEVEGRLIVAENTTIWMQRTYGSSQWDAVATVPTAMDPSFIRVSPDGSKIALGRGYGQPLLIVPTSVLSVANPPDLTSASGVVTFSSSHLSYYDGDWKDNRYFIIDGGSWPGPDCTYPYWNDPQCTFSSGVGALDTESSDPANDTGVLVTTHDGASADVDVDENDNLLVGIGWLPDDGGVNRTGELRVIVGSSWDETVPNTIDFSSLPLVADNLLTAAWMGQDAEGNLHVGGGDAFGTGGPVENGYAAIIKAGVVDDIATGTRTTPVSDGNKADNAEYKYFAPDSCQDDSATGILAGNWGRGLGVMWNPSGNGSGGCAGGAGSASDYWAVGVTPRLTIYYPTSAPDTDGDGVPDSGDNAYQTANAGQEDADGDGYGNAADADFDGDGIIGISDFNTFQGAWLSSDPVVDMDSDGTVGITDFNTFQSRWLDGAPYY